MRSTLPQCAAVLTCFLLVGASAQAQSTSERLSQYERDIETISSRLAHIHTTYVQPAQGEIDYLVENRLADGRLLFLLGDYVRASVVFLDIVETSANHNSPSYRDARYYLGESLFLSQNLVAARSFFEEAAYDRRDTRRADSIRRLLEISFMTRQYDGVQELYSMLRADSTARNRSDIIYVSGKSLYFRGDFPGAAAVFADVPPSAVEFVQAQYFLGATYVRMEEWDRAIAAFQTAAEVAETSEHPDAAEIRALAQLAVGRVHYEIGESTLARDAYQAVSRTSEHYDRALYEMGWTYIVEERYRDGLQTLEILLLAVPDSRFAPSAQLLRGDLLIRMAQYSQALNIFDSTVERFSPLAEQLSMVIDVETTADQYFGALVDTASASLMLPELARDWVEDNEDMHRALSLVSDLQLQNSEVRDSREIIEELETVLNSASRVDVFPELREGYGHALELHHRMLRLHVQLVDLEGDLVLGTAPGGSRSEYEALREQRRAVWRQLSAMPTTFDEMARQEAALESNLQGMEMEIFRLGYEVESQRAQLIALRMQVREEHAAGDRSTEGFQAANNQLDLFEEELEGLETYRDDLRRALHRERLSTGLGSVAAGNQEELRGELLTLVAREIDILGTFRGGVDGRTSGILSDLDRVRGRLAGLQQDLRAFFRDIDNVVDDQTRDIRRQLDVENALLQEYDRELREYGGRGEHLAGEIAFVNFIDVQNQFNGLILRADVGIIDVAWREKEDRTSRIESLFEERNEQLNILDSEFREVLEVE